MAECHHLTLLVVYIVAVGILQCIHAVFPCSHALDHKAPSTVCACHSHHGFCGEGRIAEIVIKSHHDTLNRFEVGSIQHYTSHFKCVYLFTCRKTVCVTAHGISFVVVGNGISKVNGIGGVILE